MIVISKVMSRGISSEAAAATIKSERKKSRSLLDNTPNYLVGCVTQKRWKNFHCGFLALRTCAFILKSVPKLLECRPTQTLGSRQDFLPSKFIHLCSFLQGHHQDKFNNNRTENIITFSYTIKYFIGIQKLKNLE